MDGFFSWWNNMEYTDPAIYGIVRHWPVEVYLPIIACAVVALATITRMWDSRDRRAAAETSAPT